MSNELQDQLMGALARYDAKRRGISVSIFIKSWSEDLKWLRYCLRFLERNWREADTEVVVMLDSDCRNDVDPGDYYLKLHLLYDDPWPDGYAHAMYQKACADKFCTGNLILLLDSDCMLMEPCAMGDFVESDGRPIIPWITYEEHNKLYPFSPWQKVTEKVMLVQTDKHYMPVMPILYWATTFKSMRRHITELHGAASFRDVVYSGEPFDPVKFPEHPHTFVDYDCLGLYAALYEPERYVFQHEMETRPLPFKQFHSWSEWNDETPRILDACLEALTAP